jgi:hypothetical protein
MKSILQKTILLLALAVSTMLLSGCATTGHARAMGCSKCACKMMQASASDPNKCKMCGHDASAHDQPTGAKSEHSEHQH